MKKLIWSFDIKNIEFARQILYQNYTKTSIKRKKFLFWTYYSFYIYTLDEKKKN
jgi:hypothetical protein